MKWMWRTDQTGSYQASARGDWDYFLQYRPALHQWELTVMLRRTKESTNHFFSKESAAKAYAEGVFV